MNNDNEPSCVDKSKKSSNYSMASFILALLPIAVVIIGLLFCMVITYVTSYNETGYVWWIFLALSMMLWPVAIIINILSIALGMIGLIRKKTLFSWAGIIIVMLEIIIFLIFIVTKYRVMYGTT